MTPTSLFEQKLYYETSGLVLGMITFLGVVLYFLRYKSPHFKAGWASVKSWFFLAPFILFMLGLPSPWPLIFLTFLSIFSIKTFYKMTGMYHRLWFVWTAYISTALLAVVIYKGFDEIFNLFPMIYLGFICWIPLICNSYRQMIQYIALSLMAFIFFGWSFLHMGKILMLNSGPYLVLYLYLLTEVSENLSLSSSRFLGKIKLFNTISPRITLEGMICSVSSTLLLAWGMRHLLPDRSEKYWIVSGLAAALFGRFGDLFLSVIRRDLGIRDTGIFIMGRGDLLARLEKLIFVGPIYYHLYIYLQTNPSL